MIGLAFIAKIAFAAQMAAVPAPKDGKTIVRLVSRHDNISIVSTSHGVRYSATDTSGRTIVTDATLDDLKEQHPELYRKVMPTLSRADNEIIANVD